MEAMAFLYIMYFIVVLILVVIWMIVPFILMSIRKNAAASVDVMSRIEKLLSASHGLKICRNCSHINQATAAHCEKCGKTMI